MGERRRKNCRLISPWSGALDKGSITVTAGQTDVDDSKMTFLIVPDSGYALRAVDVVIHGVTCNTNGGFAFTHSTNTIAEIKLRDNHIKNDADQVLVNPDVYKFVPGSTVFVSIDINDNAQFSVDENIEIDIAAEAFSYLPTQEVEEAEEPVVVTDSSAPDYVQAYPVFAAYINQNIPPWESADFSLTVTPHMKNAVDSEGTSVAWGDDEAYWSGRIPHSMASMTVTSPDTGCNTMGEASPIHEWGIDCHHKYKFDCILEVGRPTSIAKLVFERIGSETFFSEPPRLGSLFKHVNGANPRFDLLFRSSSGATASPTQYTYELMYTASKTDETDASLDENLVSVRFDNIRMNTFVENVENATHEIFDIDLHNDLTYLGTPDVAKVDSDDVFKQTGLYNLPTLTDSNTTYDTSVGTLLQATTENPNPISVLGTPGATFTVSLLDVSNSNADVTGTYVKTLDGTSVANNTTHTIPDSGVSVLKLVDLDKHQNSTKLKDFVVTAGAATTIRTAAQKTEVSSMTGGLAVSNVVKNRFVQPKSKNDIRIKITDSSNGFTMRAHDYITTETPIVSNGHTVAMVLDGPGGVDVSQVTGITNNDSGDFNSKVGETASHPYTLFLSFYQGNKVVYVKFEVIFKKFGTKDIDATLDVADILTYVASPENVTVTNDPIEVYTAGMTSDNTAVTGTGWTITADNDAEFAIINTEFQIIQ